MHKLIFGIILVIILIITGIVIASYPNYKTPDPYDPWRDEKPIICYRCLDFKVVSKQFHMPTCPIGWEDSPSKLDCSNPNMKCWVCSKGVAYFAWYDRELRNGICPPEAPIGPQDEPPDCSCYEDEIPPKPIETRTATINGNSIPYVFSAEHGYISTTQLKTLIREEFNNWQDNPYREGHVCRHMCMEIEQYLEKELAIDCFWVRGEKYWSDGHRSTHIWLYILTKDVNNPDRTVFYSFNSVNLIWAVPTQDCSGSEESGCGYTTIEVNHGNYIYGKRILKNGEPYIFRVSNYADFDYIEDYCPQCATYSYQYDPDNPMYDVVLPLSLWQKLNIWGFNLKMID